MKLTNKGNRDGVDFLMYEAPIKILYRLYKKDVLVNRTYSLYTKRDVNTFEKNDRTLEQLIKSDIAFFRVGAELNYYDKVSIFTNGEFHREVKL